MNPQEMFETIEQRRAAGDSVETIVHDLAEAGIRVELEAREDGVIRLVLDEATP